MVPCADEIAECRQNCESAVMVLLRLDCVEYADKHRSDYALNYAKSSPIVTVVKAVQRFFAVLHLQKHDKLVLRGFKIVLNRSNHVSSSANFLIQDVVHVVESEIKFEVSHSSALRDKDKELVFMEFLFTQICSFC